MIDLYALTLNTVGGILAGLAFSFWSAARRKLKSWQFKQILGPGVDDLGYTLVYEELALRDCSNKFPYLKPSGNQNFGFSISHPIPTASVRALSYLASAIGKFTGQTPMIRSDLETRALLDIDFVCFGGPGSNFMTESCQENKSNCLAIFDQAQNTFVTLPDRNPIVTLEPTFDYGLILKVRPAQFPQRVWITCAGLGEWGTSGAAWFLANKWNEIRERAGSKCFAAIVRVSPGKDQSGELIRFLV